jgi:hypothetical protein
MNMGDIHISIPDVDPHIVHKLQKVVDSIEATMGTFSTATNGMNTTATSVNTAIWSIATHSQGKTITSLSNFWSGTSTDANKANGALSSASQHLKDLKETIENQLHTIKKGMSAIATAKSYKHDDKDMSEKKATHLQNQIGSMLIALGVISASASTASSHINSIQVGGACATGYQPGSVLPTFDNTSFMSDEPNSTGSSETSPTNSEELSEETTGTEETSENGGDSGSGENGGNGGDEAPSSPNWRDPSAPWRKLLITKLVTGILVGTANNEPVRESGKGSWATWLTNVVVATAGGFVISKIPWYPENLLGLTGVGVSLNVAALRIFGSDDQGKTVTMLLPNLPGGGQWTATITESDGTSYARGTDNEKTKYELFMKPDHTQEYMVTTKDGTRIVMVLYPKDSKKHNIAKFLAPGEKLPIPIPDNIINDLNKSLQAG